MTDTTETGPDAGDGPAAARAGRKSGLDAMLLPELKRIAGGLGIRTSGLRKGALVEAIKDHQTRTTGPARAAGAPQAGDGPAAGPATGPAGDGGRGPAGEPARDRATDASGASDTSDASATSATSRTPASSADQAGGDQAGGDQAGGDQAGVDRAGGDQTSANRRARRASVPDRRPQEGDRSGSGGDAAAGDSGGAAAADAAQATGREGGSGRDDRPGRDQRDGQRRDPGDGQDRSPEEKAPKRGRRGQQDRQGAQDPADPDQGRGADDRPSDARDGDDRAGDDDGRGARRGGEGRDTNGRTSDAGDRNADGRNGRADDRSGSDQDGTGNARNGDAGDRNGKNSDRNANDRNSDRSANDRNSGGGTNDRSANDRNTGGGTNDRSANDRNSGGGTNDRSAGDRNANDQSGHDRNGGGNDRQDDDEEGGSRRNRRRRGRDRDRQSGSGGAGTQGNPGGQGNQGNQANQGHQGHQGNDGGGGQSNQGGPNHQGGRGTQDRAGQGTSGRGGRHEPDLQILEDDVLAPCAGILDLMDNYAFVRTSGYLPGADDVYVSMSLVRKFGLRRGDAVVGQVRQPREGERKEKFNPLVRIDSVNGAEPDSARSRVEFDALTPLYPSDRLRMETTPTNLIGRVIDVTAPIGKGQRGLVLSPSQAGKTKVLQSIATSVTANNPECHLMVVLVDERPEDVTEFQRVVKGEVVSSTFDRSPGDHTIVAELAIERAKRLVELGHDVVVLLDGLTRLARAYNLTGSGGRTLPGGVDSSALHPPKRFFGAARNVEDGGSLTILATALVGSGSRTDEVILEEFTSTATMELHLRREYADQRVFPAVDPVRSGTRREELLMGQEELAIVWKLRRALSEVGGQAALETLLTRLRSSQTNMEFLTRVQKDPLVASTAPSR